MNAVLTSNLFDLADKMAAAKEEKSALSLLRKQNEDVIADLTEKMSRMMLEEEIQKFERKGKTFYLSSTVYASVDPESKDELLQWLKAHDAESLITVHSQSLSAYLRELRSQSEDLALDGQVNPQVDGQIEELESLCRVYDKPSIGIRASGKTRKGRK